MQPFVIGIDAGGSGLRALRVGQDGVERTFAYQGSANPAADPASAAQAFESAFRVMLGDGAPCAAVVIGLAGRSAPVAPLLVREAFERAAKGAELPPVRRLETDVAIAHAAAFGGKEGALVAAGTGSIAVAGSREALRRFGGLGPLLGDEGSGHALGLAGLRRAALAAEGRAAADPELVAAAVRFAGQDPIAWSLALRTGLRAADFALPIADLAAAGHALSIDLCRAAGADLGGLARAALSSLSGAPRALATAGSLLGRNAVVRAACLESLSDLDFRLERHVIEPVRGAASWAWEARLLPPVAMW